MIRMYRIIRFLVLFFILLLGPMKTAKAACEVNLIDIPIVKGGSVKALYSHPQPGRSHPVVIYNHGLIVENIGYKKAAEAGYDVRDFVKALCQAGFVGLAPLRAKGYRFPDGTLKTALAFLDGEADVDEKRLGMLGFSKGGGVSLQAALSIPVFRALVLISPALPKHYDKGALKKLNSRLMLTLGVGDPTTIRERSTQELAVEFERLGKAIELRDKYPGGHKSFWKVRPDHWADVLTFLNKHL